MRFLQFTEKNYALACLKISYYLVKFIASASTNPQKKFHKFSIKCKFHEFSVQPNNAI